MSCHPDNFRLEQGNALLQFVLRIAVQALQGEPLRGIATQSGAIIFIHCNATSQARVLLSTGLAFSLHKRDDFVTLGAK